MSCRIELNRGRPNLRPLSRGICAVCPCTYTPARFATTQLNFGVVLAPHRFFKRRTSSEMIVRCAFGGLYPGSGLARHSQGIFLGVSQPVVTRVAYSCHTFKVVVLWPWTVLLISSDKFAHLRWPQLSQIAWFSEKSYSYHTIKRRLPATLGIIVCNNYLLVVARTTR